MKNKFLLILLALLIPSSYCSATKQLKGIIDAPKHLKNLPNFAIFHKGLQTYNDNTGIFTLPNKDNFNERHSILICRNFNAKFAKGNTVEGLKINRDKPYKYFVQKLDEDGDIFWKQKKLPSDLAPENAVIVRINPKHVQSVEEWNINLPKGVSALPKIVLSEKLSEKELQKASDKSVLYSLNEKPFHENVEIKKKEFKKDNQKVSCSNLAIHNI